jgi:hypothetical protein
MLRIYKPSVLAETYIARKICRLRRVAGKLFQSGHVIQRSVVACVWNHKFVISIAGGAYPLFLGTLTPRCDGSYTAFVARKYNRIRMEIWACCFEVYNRYFRCLCYCLFHCPWSSLIRELQIWQRTAVESFFFFLVVYFVALTISWNASDSSCRCTWGLCVKSSFSSCKMGCLWKIKSGLKVV